MEAHQERVNRALKSTQREINSAVDYIADNASDLHRDIHEKQKRLHNEYVKPAWENYIAAAKRRPLITTFLTLIVLFSIFPVLTFLTFATFTIFFLTTLSLVFVAISASWIISIAFFILLISFVFLVFTAFGLTFGVASIYLTYKYVSRVKCSLNDLMQQVPKAQKSSFGVNAGLFVQAIIHGSSSFASEQWHGLLSLVTDLNEHVGVGKGDADIKLEDMD